MSESRGLELRGITKSFGDGDVKRQLFDNLNADFAPGEIIAVVGRSGSGKSTLLNLIGGIETADAGTMRMGGLELTSLDDTARTLHRRRHIGFVFQFFNLIATLTVSENLLLPLELLGCTGESARQRVNALLDQLSLAERADCFPDILSGGEQQRVAIARALVHQPDLILADEPTGNLDSVTGREALALLGDLARKQNRTMILVTHSEDAAGFADRVMHLSDGVLTRQLESSV